MGIDANQVAKVDAIAFEVGRVSDDGGLSGEMRRWDAVTQRLPAEFVRRLLFKRQVRVVRRVGEKEAVLFVVIDHRIEPLAVIWWQEVAITVEPIAIQRAEAAVFQPNRVVEFAGNDIEHHFFVIAFDRHDAGKSTQLDQGADDGFGIGTTVDVVAQEDERVVRRRCDHADQSAQRGIAPVDIADRYQTPAQLMPLEEKSPHKRLDRPDRLVQ